MFANTQMMGVSTALGSEALGLTGFTGSEALSQLYSFRLELLAPNAVENVAGALLGEPISFNLEKRQFHGICARFSQGKKNTTHTPYFAEVVPWLWLLTLNRNTRGFAELSVPDILGQVYEQFLGKVIRLEDEGVAVRDVLDVDPVVEVAEPGVLLVLGRLDIDDPVHELTSFGIDRIAAQRGARPRQHQLGCLRGEGRGTVRQRTEAVESTKLLQSVMGAIDVAVFAFDMDGRLVLANPAAERLIGQPASRLPSWEARL